MDLPINPNPPRTMWIDMNSSFARTEQQAHPRLRDVPVGVGKYTNPNGPVISPSVEAKRYGIKTALPFATLGCSARRSGSSRAIRLSTARCTGGC